MESTTWRWERDQKGAGPLSPAQTGSSLYTPHSYENTQGRKPGRPGNGRPYEVIFIVSGRHRRPM